MLGVGETRVDDARWVLSDRTYDEIDRFEIAIDGKRACDLCIQGV